MKRVLGLVLVALMFASCGSSSWSCKKRYVNTEYKYSEQYKQEYVASIEDCNNY